MSGDTLIQVQQLHRYYGPLHAVQGVDFSLNRGEVLGFLGPNGAGKTTTMQMLSGNLAPSAGRVLIHGHDILDEPRAAKAALGYLPEQPPLYRELTVLEYLHYCARLNRIPKPQIAAAVDRAQERCGLGQVGKRLIGNLSKGYQQRVGIAQAIIHTPEVVILDEPTVGLDPIQIREIRALIRELGQEHSVILSTHILPEVQTTCDRVLIINRGRIALQDDLAGLDARLQQGGFRVGLQQPPTVETLLAMPGIERIERLDTQHFLLFCDTGFEPAAFAREAVEQDWGLNELSPQMRTLEQVFIDITCREETDKEAAA
ncbi:ABC transporter ATP-binding protein [Sulfuriflexus sp.]|uniref:ABC transporter ATP-binding protein n=1 Tax=Sulfuriflexus sp. TaxID=2015443 RepID=UPI0028CBECA6|nr:ABC transporter ATP-binding protein [Sulfuriflexus sp.]MDT8405196.1 ABC transporter ATP-binding protein [Sulfuriflexus sp.]